MQTIAVRSRIRVVAVGVVSALVVALGGAYWWLRATSEVRDTGTACADAVVTGAPPESAAAVRQGICASIDAMVTAWNTGDAAAFGERFTADATYVTWVGTVYRGREDIESGHAALFAGLLEGTRLTAGRVLGIDLVAPGVARVVTRSDDHKVQTYLMVDDGGTWRVAAFHNTQRSPVMERLQFLRDPGSVPVGER